MWAANITIQHCIRHASHKSIFNSLKSEAVLWHNLFIWHSMCVHSLNEIYVGNVIAAKLFFLEGEINNKVAIRATLLSMQPTCYLPIKIYDLSSNYRRTKKNGAQNKLKLPLNWIRPKFPLTITSCVNWWYVRHRYVCCASECDILIINNSPVGSMWYFPSESIEKKWIDFF